jgi:hypothetical protein
MAFDMNNFVIDRVVRGVALSQTDDSVMFALNQITNPSLSCSSESTDAVDALGTPLATFYRSKSAEFSAENAIFDMSLMAAQVGSAKQVASDSDKITTPAFETIDIDGTSATYTLKHVPLEEIKTIYALNGDGTLGTVFTKSTSASASSFAISGSTLTSPTGLKKGDQLFVIYEYESSQAVAVLNSANNFPTACKFILEVLGCDVCDQTKMVFAYLIFPNFKISPDFDWNIQSDGTHPFSGKAMQEYCDKNKRLELIAA